MIKQSPSTGSQFLKWVGDILEVSATLSNLQQMGRMVFRTNIGFADIRRKELQAWVKNNIPRHGHEWYDIPMLETSTLGVYKIRIPLLEVGVFLGKTCFIPDDGHAPIWPVGENIHIKVAPAHTAAGNMIYAAFTRQFRKGYEAPFTSDRLASHEKILDRAGYTVIPKSGTFRQLRRELDHIIVKMGFRTILLLPIHPTPTTYARMGRFGSPFAGCDFLSIDPALAEFDTHTTPLDQFHELLGAVHARGSTLYMDLPANHTGWASTFQIHNPQWFKRNSDGSFHSPGAWGTVWEDLVELDYSNQALRDEIVKVFLYWCQQGVDGFRCDAGYMIPIDAWTYIVVCVRQQFPDTVFLLEGLGGSLDVTSKLLRYSNLNWAYSELFQTYDRQEFERIELEMTGMSESHGPLVHFAETHDNLRLATKGAGYAKMRTALSALMSQQGCFGITAGVEWFACEKIDVHGAASLNWGSPINQVDFIRRLNTLLRTHPSFGPSSKIRLIQQGGSNTLAILRKGISNQRLLILVNLDASQSQTVTYNRTEFPESIAYDLLADGAVDLNPSHVLTLAPNEIRCLSTDLDDMRNINTTLSTIQGNIPIHGLTTRGRRVMAMNVCTWLSLPIDMDHLDEMGLNLIKDPRAFCFDRGMGLAKIVYLDMPTDLSRHVMVPPGWLLFVSCSSHFRLRLRRSKMRVLYAGDAVPFLDGRYGILFPVHYQEDLSKAVELTISFEVYGQTTVHRESTIITALSNGSNQHLVKTRYTGHEIRTEKNLRTLLVNGSGAMAQIRLAWGALFSQYDCLLGMNLHPTVPVDRTIFFTRCRAWVAYNGYSTALDANTINEVFIDPAGRFADWDFIVPCGMGRRVHINARIQLETHTNRCHITFTRKKILSACPHTSGCTSISLYTSLPDAVTLIIRPDIEWRNFHEKTKAFSGPESQWPHILTSEARGFSFAPDPSHPVEMSINDGKWNKDPLWQYMVPHSEEYVRGQEGASDLFSPGWFEVSLQEDQSVALTAGSKALHPFKLTVLESHKPIGKPLTCTEAMRQALRAYLVKRDAHQTVIAGYPWFLDWGRDTLIVLRGVLAAGEIETVYDVLTEFGRFEKKGTLPNMIRGEDDANRETVDAPLWFGTVIADIIKQCNSDEVLKRPCGHRTFLDILISIADNYLIGTENGIHVDPQSMLVYSPSHFTWMDTNYPAGTPREGYNVEIQALWVNLLDLLTEYADPKWGAIATQARSSFITYFTLPDHHGLADNLRASPNTAAKDAIQDDAIRSNQLYAITLGLLKDNRELATDVLYACGPLLTPGSLRSLANTPISLPLEIFHHGNILGRPKYPYRGRYEGDEDTLRKPAYHNGTGWTFTFPCYAEALYMVIGKPALETARSLLTSSASLINTDCVGHLPEITHGDAPHQACGTGAQAWGVSELLRVLILLNVDAS